MSKCFQNVDANVRVQVQDQKYPDWPASDLESYAHNLTRDSVKLLDDVLRRPTAWAGIALDSKQRILGDIQDDVDNITSSLIKYSNSETHDYPSEHNSKNGIYLN